ncbi:hypothetical protein [Kitasatospora sp. MAP5-34]|uniref:hypothetical protein n=1 Tax=Kitasatospora sp. MAP5-34 TaxID=3035102 RepID=UPI0024731041|nr:hypothetical protein [Kitasatospora sp. MAP5-34]MDH6579512.1 hypothetical protein [Kitasatospora sp. MAP5-34]
MPTHSTSPAPAYRPPPRARHAAPDRDRLGTFLASSWAALNLVGVGLLGLTVHHAEASPVSASPTVTAPDTPVA